MSKGYVSDAEKYMDQFLKDHPEVVEEQRRAEENYWVNVAPVTGFPSSLPAKTRLIPVKPQEKL